MEFSPTRRWAGVAVGSALAAAPLSLSAFLISRVLGELPSFVSFAASSVAIFLLILASCFGYWAYSCLTLRYALDRSYLTIFWGASKYCIPLSSVDGLLLGTALARPDNITGINWAWHHIGRSIHSEVGEILFFATSVAQSDLLYVLTPSLHYAISVEDPRLFARELEVRKRMGAIRSSTLSASSTSIFSLAIWSDKTIQTLLLIGVFVNLFVFGYLYYVLPSQPNLTLLKLTPAGMQDAMGLKWQALLPPAMAFAVLALNVALATVLYLRERVAAYLSLGSGLLLQIIISAAMVKALFKS